MAYISKINLPDNNTYKILSNFYAVCDTAAGTAAKTVTIDDFVLQTGVTVVIKFTNNNTASSPTLQVNSTDAKPIYRYGTTAAAGVAIFISQVLICSKPFTNFETSFGYALKL